MDSISVNRSKSGLPTITENGGGASNTGSAQIVVGASGKAVKPLFIPRGYANGDHAIFVVKPGMYIVRASRDRDGERATAYRIARLDGDTAILVVVGEHENGDGDIPDVLQDAVKAALEKAQCYHCRDVHFAAA